MGVGELVGVALGGAIGFFSAYGLEALKRRWNRAEQRRRLNRLIRILYEEVEQLAELLDIDLGIVESEELDFLMGFGKGSDEFDGRLKAAIARLIENRTIYSSQSGEFLNLPEYLPNALVRFYTRLQINCGRMLAAIEQGDIEKIRSLRSESLAEAESLKWSLREAQKDN